MQHAQCSATHPMQMLLVSSDSDHWRKNLRVIGERSRAFAIDLLGYGYSDKPDPRCASGKSNSTDCTIGCPDACCAADHVG